MTTMMLSMACTGKYALLIKETTSILHGRQSDLGGQGLGSAAVVAQPDAEEVLAI
jgi:hypothetical protein